MSEGLSPTERCEIEAECSRLVVAYAFFADHRRHEELAGLFTEDGYYANPGVTANGIAALRNYLASKPSNLKTRHVCAAPFFESIGPDEARSVTYVTVFMRKAGEPDGTPSPPGIAKFHDVFKRTPQGWRIARRVAQAGLTP